MNARFSIVVATVLGLGIAINACSESEEVGPPKAIDTINEKDLARHISILASDEFEGRAPASAGEEKTIQYLKAEFEGLGLKPGNNGSFFQEVPLVSITADPETTLTVTGASEPMNFTYGDEMMVSTRRVVEQSGVEDSDLVFVGYGIVAPEYDWNDYAAMDVTGKTVVILVNDPGYATQNPELFRGNTMTYYGRWSYKYEEAARQGAAAALIIHETAPAAYPWEVVRNGWSGEQFGLVRTGPESDLMPIEGWLHRDAAVHLLAAAGFELDTLKEEANTNQFKARGLGLKATVAVENSIRESVSRNVIATLPGSEVADEHFIYMAHWDHLGIDPSLEGDQIYNGAVDNASGIAALLELAEAFASRPERPRRSVTFLAVAAEEQGLLGSAYYGENPIIPLAKTVAGLNIDGLNYFGPTKEIMVVGRGMSELEKVLENAAEVQGRLVLPEDEPEKGYYYRSDHFELAKHGVPMLYLEPGSDVIGKGSEWGMAQKEKYTAERYHKPADEFNDTWILSGAVLDVQMYFLVGEAVATGTEWPNWYAGTEFRALRDTSLSQANE
ncbi:MAG: M28 family peptidase [Proteobacteria bacterium]|nr:M28 family peptidase [Pseudomonadota bacterium]